ncbi:hypothetical protein ACFLQY_01255 [Verrucomicrobiota bacterium]
MNKVYLLFLCAIISAHAFGQDSHSITDEQLKIAQKHAFSSGFAWGVLYAKLQQNSPSNEDDSLEAIEIAWRTYCGENNTTNSANTNKTKPPVEEKITTTKKFTSVVTMVQHILDGKVSIEDSKQYLISSGGYDHMWLKATSSAGEYAIFGCYEFYDGGRYIQVALKKDKSTSILNEMPLPKGKYVITGTISGTNAYGTPLEIISIQKAD